MQLKLFLVQAYGNTTAHGGYFDDFSITSDSVVPEPLPSISLGGLALLGGMVFAIAAGGLAAQRRRRAL